MKNMPNVAKSPIDEGEFQKLIASGLQNFRHESEQKYKVRDYAQYGSAGGIGVIVLVLTFLWNSVNDQLSQLQDKIAKTAEEARTASQQVTNLTRELQKERERWLIQYTALDKRLSSQRTEFELFRDKSTQSNVGILTAITELRGDLDAYEEIEELRTERTTSEIGRFMERMESIVEKAVMKATP